MIGTRRIVDKLGRTYLDLIYPKKCFHCGKIGRYFCENCLGYLAYADRFSCIRCKKDAILGFTHPKCLSKFWPERILYTFLYKKPVSDALRAAKFGHKAYSIYEELLGLLFDYFDELDVSFGGNSVIIPIPLHKNRLSYRGFNQANVIAALLSKHYDLPVFDDILMRTVDTKQQSKMGNRERRKENVRKAFGINKKGVYKIRNKDVLLVDDIYTTGATLLSAFRALKFETPRHLRPRYFYCLTLARD